MVKQFIIFCLLTTISFCAVEGKAVFEKYCWGCHHQTSQAFGPSFEQIANTRDSGQIIAHIFDPKSSYKALGYKRSVMPSFDLNDEETQAITQFILSYKKEK
jgi:cytochrome c551/c552